MISWLDSESANVSKWDEREDRLATTLLYLDECNPLLHIASRHVPMHIRNEQVEAGQKQGVSNLREVRVRMIGM